jgi:hypothetical protein
MIALSLAVMASFTSAATYSLDNSAAGPIFDGSAAHPWQTVAQAQTFLNAKVGGGSGDTVLVAPGDSTYGDWVDGAFGNDPFTALQKQQITRTDWLVIKAADPANPPEFRHLHLYGARHAYMEFNGLHVISRVPHKYTECVHVRTGVRRIRFLGLEVEGEDDSTAQPSGFMITYNSPGNILIENCHIHHLADALPVDGDTLIIRNNEINTIAGSAVKSGGTGYFLVEGNHIHHQAPRIVRINLIGAVTGTFVRYQTITQDVTNAKASVYYIYADHLEVTPVNEIIYEFQPGYAVHADTTNGLIAQVDSINTADASHGSGLSVRNTDNYVARGNRIHDYGSTAGIYCYPVGSVYKNTLFENNLVYDCITRTMVLNDIGENIVVRNNTLIGGFQAYAFPGYNGSGLRFYNNLTSNFTAYYDSVLTTVHEGNNIIGNIIVRSPYSYRDSISSSPSIILEKQGYGADFFMDSLFADPGQKDFRLRERSPAIDFGDPANAPAVDFYGTARDVHPDAGCFEYGAPPVVRDVAPVKRIEKNPDLPNPLTWAQLKAIGKNITIYNLQGYLVARGSIRQGGVFLAGAADERTIRKIVVISK